MKKTAIASLAAMLVLGNLTPVQGKDLGAELKKSGWDKIIGTWVDPDTKGKQHEVSYKWKYHGKVIEIISREGNKETTAMMGLNPKSGEVFHVAADNEGGSSIGKWTIQNGEAVLGILFVTVSGEEGVLEIRHKLTDADTMFVTIVLQTPVTFRLVRRKQ